MTAISKRYSVFDCDAHINDHAWMWQDWQKYFSAEERALVQSAYWHFGDQGLINARTVYDRAASQWFTVPGPQGTLGPSPSSVRGPGMDKKLLRKIYHS